VAESFVEPVAELGACAAAVAEKIISAARICSIAFTILPPNKYWCEVGPRIPPRAHDTAIRPQFTAPSVATLQER
jgi:hypothetical protein